MPNFQVWDEETGDETCARTFDGVSPREAALNYAEETFSSSDYAAERRIIVIAESGARAVFDVFAEQTVDFHAYEVPPRIEVRVEVE